MFGSSCVNDFRLFKVSRIQCWPFTCNKRHFGTAKKEICEIPGRKIYLKTEILKNCFTRISLGDKWLFPVENKPRFIAKQPYRYFVMLDCSGMRDCFVVSVLQRAYLSQTYVNKLYLLRESSTNDCFSIFKYYLRIRIKLTKGRNT